MNLTSITNILILFDESLTDNLEEDRILNNFAKICCIFVALTTYFYYKQCKINRKLNRFPAVQQTLTHISYITILPSITCCMVFAHFMINILKSLDINPSYFEYFTIFLSFGAAGLIIIYRFLMLHLLDVFIIVLTAQRVVVIYLSPNKQFLVKQKYMNWYIRIIWGFSIITTFFQVVGIELWSKFISKVTSSDRELLVLSYYLQHICSIFAILLCSFLYFSLFWYLFKQRSERLLSLPETAFLYEGLPLLITRVIFLSKVFKTDIKTGEFMNYEIRFIIISNALVQFTSVFNFNSLRQFHGWILKFVIFHSNVISVSDVSQSS
ncbi:unnamed protein product [Caenorhabditis angaria]|uniref:Uncharacterized protein n=1 Tax=Caenorhabditis angaria TaxID=860376 RepID=A0A9P1IDF3_9PELO|nr:unnamed protein product [Caenorhabditis angaria]